VRGIKSGNFLILLINNHTRIAMIAKSFVLAKDFYRYSVLILRDHGNATA
jgi:hypothetical protein